METGEPVDPSPIYICLVTRLRMRHNCLNAYMYSHLVATQPDTPEHLLLYCPCYHPQCTTLFHSMVSLQIHRPSLTNLLGGSQYFGLAFKTLKHIRTFL
ncbi:hypothetical protein E2C01_037265 [Portunus trituberculatus]|uniref:Uncharacterized protein n=1 Tax=Portunus trituberculatus TaxID=210409 RepID=A0A5B7FDR0_PORTR|nr:hypothetical protein [Portunus trituberculatus]